MASRASRHAPIDAEALAAEAIGAAGTWAAAAGRRGRDEEAMAIRLRWFPGPMLDEESSRCFRRAFRAEVARLQHAGLHDLVAKLDAELGDATATPRSEE